MLKTFNDLKRVTCGTGIDYTYVGKVQATTAILNKFVTLYRTGSAVAKSVKITGIMSSFFSQ